MGLWTCHRLYKQITLYRQTQHNASQYHLTTVSRKWAQKGWAEPENKCFPLGNARIKHVSARHCGPVGTLMMDTLSWSPSRLYLRSTLKFQEHCRVTQWHFSFPQHSLAKLQCMAVTGPELRPIVWAWGSRLSASLSPDALPCWPGVLTSLSPRAAALQEPLRKGRSGCF